MPSPDIRYSTRRYSIQRDPAAQPGRGLELHYVLDSLRNVSVAVVGSVRRNLVLDF